MTPIAQADLTTALDQAPAALTGVLVVGLLLGLGLWLLGRKLARPCVGVSGLILGGIVGMILGQQNTAGNMLLPIVVFSAVAGCLCAVLLYRLWMGVSCAVLLALAAPLAWVAWAGTPPPQDQTLDLSQPPPQSQNADGLVARAQAIYDHEVRGVSRWWSDLGDAKQRELVAIASVAGLAGLVLGLILPNLAASVQSAFLGSLLMLGCAGGLIRAHWHERASSLIPDSSRTLLIVLGLITLSGVLIQWTIWRRKADNGS